MDYHVPYGRYAVVSFNDLREFSESLHEMGGCLIEKAELYKDDESKKAFMMLGKVQFELQKLVDFYRSHIFLTITKPSESLLDELQTVQDRTYMDCLLLRVHGYRDLGCWYELNGSTLGKTEVAYGNIGMQRGNSGGDICFRPTVVDGAGHMMLQVMSNELVENAEMKQQCDEKRSVYEYMMTQHREHREKGRSKSGKGDVFSLEQMQQAHNEYEEEATLCLFRLKSLKQGQSRSLLTQAARHHTAQVFPICSGWLSATDYAFQVAAASGLLLAFIKPHAITSGFAKLDQEDHLFSKASNMDNTEFSSEKVHGDSQMLESEPRTSSYSHSAPILPEKEKKFDPAERARQMRPSHTQKFHTYVLPTPSDAKSTNSARTSSAPRTRPTTVATHNIWHSSP
ncbi:hypothetical protein RDABS01_005782 [Bienertia sinuspersici]